jgi:DNA helicase-2/ATP-dependent DNA helicase PcrA
MAWSDGLTEEQATAASYVNGHSRLLAGPGTGKTRVMTRHVAYLVNERMRLPNTIMALTFTRHAAAELKMRVTGLVDVKPSPYVATLHSFALRQLLKNASLTAAELPQPLRIADDYEERWIIIEDLKGLLDRDVDDTKDSLQRLSADWETLNAETASWEKEYPDPAFLGAWHEHRRVYGYTLRAELVYRLKRAVEQYPDFIIEGPPQHLLVDEYQDLNRCDQAVVRALSQRGAQLFVAGDDDQSIYGFRYAHPQGIRNFEEEYEGATTNPLTVCKRCDQAILDLATWVVSQDYQREPKKLKPDDGCGDGEVRILRFAEQGEEGVGVASLCRTLVDDMGYSPHDILILLRQDRHAAYSHGIKEALQNSGLDASVVDEQDPFGVVDGIARPGRSLLAAMRIAVSEADSLAWRTLLDVRKNGVGTRAITFVWDYALSNGTTFYEALEGICENPSVAGRFGPPLVAEFNAIREMTSGLEAQVEASWEPLDPAAIASGVEPVATSLISNESELSDVMTYIKEAAELTEPEDLAGLLHALSLASSEIEQHITEGKVSILTMHKAKGLTAKAVIVVAAEDQLVPGRADTADELGEERRLLYVSLTRAEHFLFITHCERRTGQQSFTGRDSGNEQRHLTQFLRDGPIPSESGTHFVEQFAERQKEPANG